MPPAEANVFLLQDKYQDVLSALEKIRPLPQAALEAKPHRAVEASLLEGIAHEKLGETTAARAAFLQAKETAAAAVREVPDEHSRHAMLARALAHLGEKEAAIVEATRATELLPESVDAFEGPGMTAALAEVYALTGENAKAIALLDGLLSRPSDLTVALLEVDPTMDGLREDPTFAVMLAKH